MFLHSIFIGGQGFRRKTNFIALYPKLNILHPQVQLIGSILVKHASFGIADECIGVRSHSDQIIFRALKDKEVQLDGDHMNIELPRIYRFLKSKYSLKNSEAIIVKQLVDNYPPVIIKEKMFVGNQIVTKYYKKFTALSQYARKSRKLKLIYYVTLFTPASVLAVTRFVIMRAIQLINIPRFRPQEELLKKILMLS